jgi:hypothetical protein
MTPWHAGAKANSKPDGSPAGLAFASAKASGMGRAGSVPMRDLVWLRAEVVGIGGPHKLSLIQAKESLVVLAEEIPFSYFVPEMHRKVKPDDFPVQYMQGDFN